MPTDWMPESEFPVIRFSHYFVKLACAGLGIGGGVARLVACLPVRLEDLSPDFLEYDTRYWDIRKGTFERYPLPKTGNYLLLLFVHEDKIFSTLRSAWGKHGDTRKYYEEMVGKIFRVEIKEKED